MWFEVLPTVAIMTTLLALPPVGYLIVNQIAFGNFYQRHCHGEAYKRFFLRDQRLAGRGWKSLKLRDFEE